LNAGVAWPHVGHGFNGRDSPSAISGLANRAGGLLTSESYYQFRLAGVSDVPHHEPAL
jgi:hypothetical protein